jgi:hypothetical protein
MSTQSEQPINLTNSGWAPRRPTDTEMQGIKREPGDQPWLYEQSETGLKTPIFFNVLQAKKAAIELEKARQSGQLDDINRPADPSADIHTCVCGQDYDTNDHEQAEAHSLCVTPAEIREAIDYAYKVVASEGSGAPAADSDAVADTDAADTPEADEPTDEGEEQPDGFPNAGAGFSRGLASPDTTPSPELLFKLPAQAPAPPILTPQVHPSRIGRHPQTLMRASGIDHAYVEELRVVLREGFALPAVDVFNDGDKLWLADGNHRVEAAIKEGRLVDINEHRGTVRDAIAFAVKANARHGRRREVDDKRLAVVTVLCDTEWSSESDTAIARRADVSQPFVGNVQGWLESLVRPINGQRAQLGEGEAEAVTDADYSKQADAPEGLVHIVRALPEEDFERLSHNVIGRATTRKGSDGRKYAVAPSVDEPALFTGLESASTEEEGHAPAPAQPEPVQAAQTQAAGSEDGPSDEASGEPSIVVNDRRRFSEEASTTAQTAALPAGYTSTPPSQQRVIQQETAPLPATPARPPQPTIEELLKGRAGAISFAWIPGLKGKVNVTVNVGGKPANEAKRFMLDTSLLPAMPEDIMSVVKEESGARGATAKTAAAATSPEPAKDAPAKKVERIITGIKGSDTAADLDKTVAYFKLDNLSRFTPKEAKTIKDTLAAQRRKVAASSSKKASKKSGAKTPAKSAAKKSAAKKKTSAKK